MVNETTYAAQWSAAQAAAQAVQVDTAPLQQKHNLDDGDKNKSATTAQQQQQDEEEEEDYEDEDEEHEPYFNTHEKPLLRRLPKRLRHKMLPFFDPTSSQKYPLRACDNHNHHNDQEPPVSSQTFLACWPLWMADYQNVRYIIGKPVHTPIAIYRQVTSVPQPTQQQPYPETATTTSRKRSSSTTTKSGSGRPKEDDDSQLPAPEFYNYRQDITSQNGGFFVQDLLPVLRHHVTQSSQGRYQLQWQSIYNPTLRLIDTWDQPTPTMDEVEREATIHARRAQEYYQQQQQKTKTNPNPDSKESSTNASAPSSSFFTSPPLVLDRSATRLLCKVRHGSHWYYVIQPLYPVLHAAACIRHSVQYTTDQEDDNNSSNTVPLSRRHQTHQTSYCLLTPAECQAILPQLRSQNTAGLSNLVPDQEFDNWFTKYGGTDYLVSGSSTAAAVQPHVGTGVSSSSSHTKSNNHNKNKNQNRSETDDANPQSRIFTTHRPLTAKAPTTTTPVSSVELPRPPSLPPQGGRGRRRTRHS